MTNEYAYRSESISFLAKFRREFRGRSEVASSSAPNISHAVLLISGAFLSASHLMNVVIPRHVDRFFLVRESFITALSTYL